jgi:hypothetical protein
MMNSLVPLGVFIPGLSIGVGGIEEDTAEVGVGREGSLVGGAIGKVRESRFAFRDAVEVERDLRVGELASTPVPVGNGGGGIASVSPPALNGPDSSAIMVVSWAMTGVECSGEGSVVVVASGSARGSTGARSAAEEQRRRNCW